MTRCTITYREPGCTTPIYYDDMLDDEVPMYCPKHRSVEGRHSETRVVTQALKVSVEQKLEDRKSIDDYNVMGDGTPMPGSPLIGSMVVEFQNHIAPVKTSIWEWKHGN